MRVNSLRLNNFRNITELDLGNLGITNILIGANAQGKTNILEAFYSVASGSSFRTSQSAYLIKLGEKAAMVFVEGITDGGREKYIQLYWNEEGRVIKINGVPASSGDLIKAFPAVIFSPEDIDLLRLSSTYRRRFLDLAIGRHDREYAKNLADFRRIRSQRNQLLLMIKQQKALEEELDVWDEKMAQVGAAIVERRMQFVSELSGMVKKYYVKFSANGSNAGVDFIPNINSTRKTEYLNILRGSRGLDIARATTNKGIHRDDLIFTINNQDIRHTASRGEFRSMVLALKFAEGEYLKEKLEETPIYLLDDVFSELDESRRQAMVEEIKKRQSFITANNQAIPKLFSEPKVFEIEKGEIKNHVPAT
ncbi:hypothetical protein DRH29_00865 [candidate division Kazan bacterium]|uniref:DNA replication and repair protein RecF n=1 Tax=candidate division Kazan bacterium TaxID=2202143 RepID=A0A420ZDE8_UNCK3|nr:MAG: hypothetical protein DRH29_00865 [candidate division Kazan bacterium]